MRALKVRNTIAGYSALSVLHACYVLVARGDPPRCARRLPLAVIFRAFGAAQIDFRLARSQQVALSSAIPKGGARW